MRSCLCVSTQFAGSFPAAICETSLQPGLHGLIESAACLTISSDLWSTEK